MSSWEFAEQGLLVLPFPKELSSSSISQLSCLCIFLTHWCINCSRTSEILGNAEHLISCQRRNTLCGMGRGLQPWHPVGFP